MVNRNRKKIFTALSAVLVVAVLATGGIVATQGKTTDSAPTQTATNQNNLEVAKSAGDKKVEVIKG